MNYKNYIIYKHDSGLELPIYTGLDLTGASVTVIRVLKPNGITETWPATIDSVNSKILNCITGVFDFAGMYYLNAYVELGALKKQGSPIALEVFDTE